MMLRVTLMGSPRIETDDGVLREVRGQKPWAVLARMLLADRPLSRRELSSALFPDTDDPLGSLRWCLAGLRKALGSSELFTGDPVDPSLPPAAWVDVLALDSGDVEAAGVGELLEGIDPPCGAEFTTWLLVARQQVAARAGALLREGTITAISRGEHDRAVALAELAARREPFDEGAQVLLVKSLVMAGHRSAALRHVVNVEGRFRKDLGIDPSPALRSAARASLAAAPPGVSAEVLASSLLDSGRAALAAGAVDAGLDSLRRAGAQAEAAADDALLGRCLHELGSALVHAVRGFDDEGCVLLEQSVQLARSAGDVPTAVASLRERGYADALAGRRPQARHHLEQAAELADGEVGLEAGVRTIEAFNLADWGRYDDAIARYQEAVDLTRRAADRRREGWALGLGGWALLSAGRTPEAVTWLTECVSVVRDLHWVSFEPWPMAVLWESTLLGGDHRDVTHGELEHCFAMSCELDDPCWEGASGRVLAIYHERRGDIDGALRWITESRVRCIRRTDTWVGLQGSILLTEAELRLTSGDAAGANAAARDAVSLAARAHLDGLLSPALDVLSKSS